MKKVYILLVALFAMATLIPAQAQDTRKRTTETIVQDVLAQMPTQTQADFNKEMGDLVKAAPQSIEMLAKMLQPAEKHANGTVEYAIGGAVAYATTNAQYRKAVTEGVKNALKSPVDDAAKTFLQLQLRILSTENDVTYAEHKGAPVYAAAYDKLQAAGDKAGALVAKAVKSKDRALRMQALKYATDKQLTDEATVKMVCAKYKSCKEDGKVDIINWIGDNKISSQKDLLAKAVEAGGAPAKAACEALGKIGGDDAAEILVAQLGTDNNDAAYAALRSFRSDIAPVVNAALKGGASGAKQEALFQLAYDRRIRSAADQVFQLAPSSDAARKALPGVVSPKDASRVAALLDGAADNQVGTYQSALAACVKSLDAKAQYEAISGEMKKASNKARFFSTLAATGTDESVAELVSIAEPEAINALKKSQNWKAADPLLAAAKKGDEDALKAYVRLVNAKVTNNDTKYNCLSNALAIAKSADMKKSIIASLGNTPLRSSFLLVGKSLDVKELAYTAAAAEKEIIKKSTEDIEYEAVKENLNKAIKIYQANGSADDGYAVDELKKILAELQPAPVFELSEEEKKEGFEILFDGTNMDKWIGNKELYAPINGCIYVTANYGNDCNLYTAKEYRDFIYRFEFCFEKPGVNNGVGIRTPMGVDAAYEAMCESQILDHDDPIYAGLAPYQVHGSVYGVIPAKRIKHKPLGEWSTEEIRVKGNHITVIVNGETIVDGDVKEACKGHNVAPDGSDRNPYTADHRNHPGMFNKQGHISFCGHGKGVKFRNIRIKELK